MLILVLAIYKIYKGTRVVVLVDRAFVLQVVDLDLIPDT